jgi:hypothetical protein
MADLRDFQPHWPLLLSDKRAQTDNSTGAGRAFTLARGDVAYRLAILVMLRGEWVFTKIATPIRPRIGVVRGIG